ncbi:MAG TPA: hypothetical protein VNI01_04600 [Elusimicrobiota bacterium]|jgi:hypothetical protein|nr:hypothetical protein [Elusimicrobiota bacterium]
MKRLLIALVVLSGALARADAACQCYNWFQSKEKVYSGNLTAAENRGVQHNDKVATRWGETLPALSVTNLVYGDLVYVKSQYLGPWDQNTGSYCAATSTTFVPGSC